MEISDQELFNLKKKMLELDFSQKFYDGAYLPSVHGIDINIKGRTYPQAVIAYIHEKIHYLEQNGLFGILLNDLIVLYLTLAMYYEKYKEKLLIDYLKEKDISDLEKYIFTHAEELDYVLCKDCQFVKFLEFCVEVYETYKTLVINSKFINECIATYISLHIDSSYSLFDSMGLGDLFYDRRVMEEISSEQHFEIEKILKMDESNIYKAAYLYMEKLVKEYNIEMVLSFNDIIVNSVPFYNFDLLTEDDTEREHILNRYYGADKKWLNLQNLEPSRLYKLYNNLPAAKDQLIEYICGFATSDFPPCKRLAYTWEYSFEYLWRHKRVKSAIALIEGPHEPLVAEYNFLQNFCLASKMVSNKIQMHDLGPIFESVSDTEPIIVDRRILNFPQLSTPPIQLATDLLIRKIYITMKRIITLSKEELQ